MSPRRIASRTRAWTTSTWPGLAGSAVTAGRSSLLAKTLTGSVRHAHGCGQGRRRALELRRRRRVAPAVDGQRHVGPYARLVALLVVDPLQAGGVFDDDTVGVV